MLDRVQWVREMLTGIGIWVGGDRDPGPDKDCDAENDEKKMNTMPSRTMQVEMVNLFDQATGSGRNIAIVVAPPSVIPQPFAPSSPG